MDDLNSYILQQVIKKKSNLEEGTPNDHKKQKKHVKRLVQFVGLVSNNQASVSINDDQDYRHFDLVITPKEGPYCDAEITFHFQIKASYPTTPPVIKCLNTIYHPNIDDEGDICLSIINEWHANTNDLLDCLQGLMFILYNPNLEDPLSPYFEPDEDEDGFLYIVRKTLAGGVYNGIQFDCLL